MPGVYELNRMISSTNVPNECSYHSARRTRKLCTQKAKIMDTCTSALEDRDCETVDNMDADIKNED